MPVLVDELDAAAARWLRQITRAHAKAWRGRLLVTPHLYVGSPCRPVEDAHGVSVGSRDLSTPVDQTLRVDIVAQLLAEAAIDGGGDDPVWVWLTRRGELATHDLDLAWLAATLAAAGEQGVDPHFVVVTRRGWRDPRSAVGREWARLRT